MSNQFNDDYAKLRADVERKRYQRPVAHVGSARGTVTLSDGSVWSHKGDYWLSGADADFNHALQPEHYRDPSLGPLSADEVEAVRIARSRSGYGTDSTST